MEGGGGGGERGRWGGGVCYLTALLLPENGWLRVSGGFALEGDGPANPDHLVPRSHHKHRGHWRTAQESVSDPGDITRSRNPRRALFYKKVFGTLNFV